MRRLFRLSTVAGLIGAGALGLVAGCWPFADVADCATVFTNCPTSSSSSGGPDGGHNCDPALGAVDESCGVFVSATAAPDGGQGSGTMASPFQTFAEAAAANPARVYACAGSYVETMPVTFTGGVDVYGGFTGCTAAGWTWNPNMQAQITTVANAPGVVLDGATNKLEGVSVTAPAATMPGGSSIALVVNGGSLDMSNGALTAGDAMAGTPGTTVPDDSTLDGAAGDSGVGVCMTAANNPGPAGKTNTCSTGGSSLAGNGGDGGLLSGTVLLAAGSGTDGSPPNPGQPASGKGGTGEGQGTPAALSCVSGTDGANGATGMSATGASGTGSISASGYTGAMGGGGANGLPGQGGGGGGGVEGGLMIDCGMGPADRVGASGGAGGTGGCGGAAGGGGNPGGSSLALVSFGATVTFTQVTLTAGKAGAGGAGGNGQSGGQKGMGGSPGAGKGTAQASCQGGYGGQGGPGGPGGGGQGGHSLGVAYKGAPPTGGTFMINPANNGTGGPGGSGNATTNNGKGADGTAANTLAFN